MARSISKDIRILVKSLSKPEKRYFRFYTSMGNANENMIYLRLFDTIETQKTYDEKRILKKIPEIKPQQLSNQKGYLEELILESLQWYHSGRSVDARLWALISKIKILYDKGLFKHCIKQIKKAKELAKYYEKFRQLTEILTWERRVLYKDISEKKLEAMLDAVLIDNISAVEKIKNDAEYRLLYKQIHRFNPSSSTVPAKGIKQELHKILKHPLLKDEKKSSFFYERANYYSIYSHYYFILHDWEKYYLYQKKHIADYESCPWHMNDSNGNYIHVLGGFLVSSILTRKEKEIENSLDKVNHLMIDPAYSGNRNAMLDLCFCLIDGLYYYIESGNFQKGVSLTKTIEEYIIKFSGRINKSREMYACYSISYFHFGVGNYKDSLSWVNRILNDASDVRKDILVCAHLINLLIHFELKNERGLSYFAKSTYRFLLKKDRLYKIEVVVIEFIRKKISKIYTRVELLNSFKELKSNIEIIAKEPAEQQALEYFDFIAWLEGKITGKPFAEVLKGKWKEQGRK